MARASRFWGKFVLILASVLVLYLIGNQRIALWDRDEPRYAQCSRQMLQSGDWVVPHFLDKLRYQKPPLIYWCQAISMKLLGDTGFAARLPSVLATMLSSLLLGLAVRYFAGPMRALWTVLIFCSSGLVIAAAKMCITDAVLMFFVLTGQICLAILWFHGRHRNRNFLPRSPPAWVAPLLWASTGMAGLAKGPQALGMHLMTIVFLLLLDVGGRWRSRRAWIDCLRWLRLTRIVLGVPILAIIVVPWIYMIHVRSPGFITEMLHVVRQHAGSDVEGHAKPPGYHALLIFGTFFPWSLLFPVTFLLSWRRRHTPVIRFAIAAALGPWLVMELVRVKLPFYVMPSFPALAFLTAEAVVRCARGRDRAIRFRSFRIEASIWGTVTLLLAAAPWLALLITQRGLPIAAMVTYTICGIGYVVFVVNRLFKRRIVPAALAMAGGMAVMLAILFVGIIPYFTFFRLPEKIANDLKAHDAYGPHERVAMVGYREPSLAFYQGGGAYEEPFDYYLQVYPPEQWAKWIVIDQEVYREMRNPEIFQHLIPIGSEEGIAYSSKITTSRVLIFKSSPATLPSIDPNAK